MGFLSKLFGDKQVGPTQDDVMRAATPWSVASGMGGVRFDPSSKQATAYLSPEMQALVDRMQARGAEYGEQIEAFDPYQAGQDYYSQFMADPQRLAQAGQTSRARTQLAGSGMLGSYAGQQQMQGLMGQQALVQQAAQAAAFDQAQLYQGLMSAREAADYQTAFGLMEAPTGMFGTGGGRGSQQGQILSCYRPQ